MLDCVVGGDGGGPGSCASCAPHPFTASCAACMRVCVCVSGRPRGWKRLQVICTLNRIRKLWRYVLRYPFACPLTICIMQLPDQRAREREAEASSVTGLMLLVIQYISPPDRLPQNALQRCLFPLQLPFGIRYRGACPGIGQQSELAGCCSMQVLLLVCPLSNLKIIQRTRLPAACK